MSSKNRKRLFVDRKVQGALLFRVAMYWMYCLLTVTLLMSMWTLVKDKPVTSVEWFDLTWGKYGPVFLASLILLPMVLMDCLRVSNRFAGPVFRLRKSVKKLADGGQVAPIHFREGDFWYEFAEDFNRAVARFQNEDASHVTARESDDSLAEEPVAV